MLTGDKEENPLLNDNFRKEFIDPIENNKSAAAQTASPARQELSDGFKETEINISTELISEWLPSTLKRFNCCTCGRCSAEASAEAFSAIEPVKYIVRSPEDLEKVKELKEQYKRKVMMKLIGIAVARKNLPVHDS